MKAKVPHAAREDLWPFVRHLLPRCTRYLPMIAALASITLALEKVEVFRGFDDRVVAFAASAPANLEEPNDFFSSWIISPQLFNTEFERKLPVDKLKLGRVLKHFADQASVIAVDVDAIPMTPIPLDAPDLAERAKQQPMFEAIKPLLDSGRSVVLLSRGSAGDASHAARWRNAYCQAAQSFEQSAERSKNGTRRGKLWWAAGLIEAEGSGVTVLRYFSPEQAIARARAGIDSGLLPLGLVLAVASRHYDKKHDPELSEIADHCSQDRIKPSVPSEKAMEPPDAFINFFSKVPAEIAINSLDSVSVEGTSLPHLNGAIIVGVRGSDDIDIHGTPVGTLVGATIHATIAASVANEVRNSHALAFLLDVAAGYLFVSLFHLLQYLRDRVIEAQPDTPTVHWLVSFACPLLALCAVALLLMFAPRAAAHGWWLNPIPVLIGMMAHLYVELIPGVDASHSHGPRKAFAAWQAHVKRSVKDAFGLSHVKGAVRTDAWLWLSFQLALFGLILNGLRLLVTGH